MHDPRVKLYQAKYGATYGNIRVLGEKLFVVDNSIEVAEQP